MKNNFALEQISRRLNLETILKLHQHKLDSMARFMDIKSINPKTKQKETAGELGYSSSTLQRYRIDTKRQIAFKSNNPNRSPKTSNDHKRPQMT